MKTIEFEVTKDGYTLRDAIVLDDNVVLSDDEIEAIKQKRFDDWYAIVTAEPVEEPVIEELVTEEPVVEEHTAEEVITE